MPEWYEDPDTLWTYLQQNKDKIWYVQLIWTWPEYIEKESPYCFMNDGVHWPLHARWVATRIDPEYTFIGPIDEAIEYATKYDCWDRWKIEENAAIEGGVLICETEGYDPDGREFPSDNPADENLYDLQFCGLYYHKNNHAYLYDTYHKEPPILWPKLEGD